MKNNKAFTLIELLVVVLIIGILAAIAVPQYQVAVAKAKYSNLKPLVKAIAQAEEIFLLTNGTYTPNIEDLNLDLPERYIEKICDDNGCDYTFDWGYCSLNVVQNYNRVVCENSSANIRYRIMLQDNNSERAGKQGCNAVNGNIIADKICKAEGTNTAEQWQSVGTVYYF